MLEQFVLSAVPRVETACCASNPLTRICLGEASVLTFGEFLKFGGPREKETPGAPLLTAWSGT